MDSQEEMVVEELAEPSAEGPAKPIEKPTEQTLEQPSEYDDNITKTSALEIIMDWVEEQVLIFRGWPMSDNWRISEAASQ